MYHRYIVEIDYQYKLTDFYHIAYGLLHNAPNVQLELRLVSPRKGEGKGTE